MVLLALACAAVLIATAPVALMIADAARARALVYGTCLAVSSALLLIALLALLGISGGPSTASLPLGIPWLGAHFRLDALAAFFLAVVGLGADTAATVGKARGEVEVKDGATGEQLMAGIDERVGTRGVEGVTDKWSDVQMAFDDWAERIRLRLAEHRGPQPAPAK